MIGDAVNRTMLFLGAALAALPLPGVHAVATAQARGPAASAASAPAALRVYDTWRNYTTRDGLPSDKAYAVRVAGGRVWQRDLRMRLWVGPLGRDRFDEFLPGGRAAKALSKWLALLSGSTLEYEVRLGLKADHVRGVSMQAASVRAAPTDGAFVDGGTATTSAMAQPTAAGARLGWDSYLCSRQATAARHDTTYFIHTPP